MKTTLYHVEMSRTFNSECWEVHPHDTPIIETAEQRAKDMITDSSSYWAKTRVVCVVADTWVCKEFSVGRIIEKNIISR